MTEAEIQQAIQRSLLSYEEDELVRVFERTNQKSMAISRDGNCLFEALLLALQRNNIPTLDINDANTMRRAIVRYVLDNQWQFVFASALNVDHIEHCDAPDHTSAEDWANTMIHNTVFGDNLCIIAASRLFQTMIVVTSESQRPDGTLARGCENFGGEFQEVNGYISLILKDQHYEIPSFL